MARTTGSWIEGVVGAPLPTSEPLRVAIHGIANRRAFYETLAPAADPPGAVVVDDAVTLRNGSTTLTGELYRPCDDQGQPTPDTLPVFLFLHGGGFCIWNARMVRRAAMRIAAAGFVVLSIDYRLAPENPFPAALEDTVYAAHWLRQNAERLGIDLAKGLSIGGDSSGANLTAAATSYFLSGMTSLTAAEHQDATPLPIHQILLLCGIFDLGKRLVEKTSGPGTTEVMVNLAYLGPQFLTKHSDPLVSPARADNVDDFPRTFIACGSADSTLPQSLALTATLADAGVDVTLSVFAGGDHEMLLLAENQLPGVDAEWSRILAWLSA
ncbi:alpha/beta hydrolase [Nocardia sp. NPDC050408]|uniref:alpha/beta hydrolase n=1 Tax=Nocardia sp. NPDC050408 TaxID=3364319 RepID=UPI00378F54BC